MPPVGIIFEYCPACRKRLRSVPILLVHMQSVHWRDKPLTCTDCGAKHYDATALSRCKKRHQGMYRCYVPNCKCINRSMADIRTHLMLKHGVANPGDDGILFDRSLAKADRPKTRPSSSFISYKSMTKEELIAESAKVRLEEENRVSSLAIQEVATVSHQETAIGFAPDNSYWTSQTGSSTAEAQFKIKVSPSFGQGSQWEPPFISHIQRDHFQGTSSLYHSSSPLVWGHTSGTGLWATLTSPSDGIPVNHNDSEPALWLASTSLNSTPAGTETLTPRDWTIFAPLDGYGFPSS